MEEKRKLPSWMVRKPLDVVVKDEEESGVVTEPIKPKGKSVMRKKDDTFSSDGSSFLVKCGRKRKKSGLVEKEVVECRDDEGEVGVVEKRKCGRVGVKDEESDRSRKKNRKDCEFVGGNENEDISSDEDDLTIEDMLIIAKEFVENDKREKGQQRPSEVQCELKNKSLHTRSSMTRTSPIAPQETRSHTIEKPASNNHSIEKTSEVTLGDIRMTDDPAQDMLDLFLGPLLEKPIGKEETVSIKDVVIPHEPKSQQREAVVSNKPVTFAKKKSSLRDAVACFLSLD